MTSSLPIYHAFIDDSFFFLQSLYINLLTIYVLQYYDDTFELMNLTSLSISRKEFKKIKKIKTIKMAAPFVCHSQTVNLCKFSIKYSR